MSELLAGNTEERPIRSIGVTGHALNKLLMAIDEDNRQVGPDITGRVSGVIPLNFDKAARAICECNGLAFERDSKFELRLCNGGHYLVCSYGVDC